MQIEPSHRTWRAALGASVLLSLAALLAAAGLQPAAAAVPPANTAIAIVAEIERPAGIKASSATRIRALAGDSDGEQGVALLREFLTQNWQQVRALDVVGMSRYHVDVTRGWQVPAVPGKLPGRIIAAEDDGTFYVEVVGPRLPASFSIVHRHLTFYARYQPATGKLDRLTATIRLEVFE